MKKISRIIKAVCSLALTAFFSFSAGNILSAGKVFSASAGAPVNPAVTNEYSGKEQFTKVPGGTFRVDIASGVWKSLPDYSCNNLNVGKNVNGTWCTYKLMWNNEKLFFSVTAKDLTWNDDDMIEIGIRYKDQNWGYIFATMAPWVGAGAFHNGGVTFIDFEANEEENVRSIYFSADLKDRTMLREKESFLMNVNYYDYGDRVNGEKSLICRLQSGVAASGDPCQFFPLAGSRTAATETPDETLYNHVDQAYENGYIPSSGDGSSGDGSSGDGSSESSSSGGSSTESVSSGGGKESGCGSRLACSVWGILAVSVFGIFMIGKNKKIKAWRKTK